VKPFTIHAEAEAETQGAIAHDETERAGLGREFRQEFEAAASRIQRMPQASAPIDDQGTRKQRFQRIPYTIYYVELDDAIWIAAVAHQKRRPGYWSGRTPQSGADA
jgi:toxin ParE1/3/4